MINVVSFPGLGLEFTLNRVAFTLFGRPIYWYGILIGFGFLLAVMLCCKRAPQYGLTEEHVLDALFYAVPLGLIGVRAYYVIFYLDLYRLADGSLDWAAIFRYSDGGLAIYGGLIGGILGIVLFARRRKISFLAFVDLCVLGLPLSQAIGRWGNFMNVEAYGAVTDVPWRMCSESIARELWAKGLLDTEAAYFAIIEGEMGVHPTFLYESIWNLAGFILMYFLGKYTRKFDGQLFFSYVLWYGVGRTWIEGMRTDSLLFFGMELFGIPIRTSQVLAFSSAAAAGVILLWQFRKKHGPEALYVNRVAAQEREEQTGGAEEES